MKTMILGLALSVLAGLPLLAALKIADKAPDFSARASLAGKEFNFSLQDALKKGPVVVYFYPSAYTKGCDLEAHTFARSRLANTRLPRMVVPRSALMMPSADASGTSTSEKRSAISIAPMSRPLRLDSPAIAPTMSCGRIPEARPAPM